MTKVRITEHAPKAEQIVHDLKAVQALVKTLERYLKAKDNRRRANETGRNKSQRQDADRDKSTALEIAARLVKQNPALGLPGKTSDLVRRILRRWPPNRTPPKFRTLCRYLTGK